MATMDKKVDKVLEIQRLNGNPWLVIVDLMPLVPSKYLDSIIKSLKENTESKFAWKRR